MLKEREYKEKIAYIHRAMAYIQDIKDDEGDDNTLYAFEGELKSINELKAELEELGDYYLVKCTADDVDDPDLWLNNSAGVYRSTNIEDENFYDWDGNVI